ncbi:MAG: nuclear transport factor 2 family protein [Erythrobacter sp.]
MADLSDILTRLDRLESEAEIRRLVATYFRICDDLGPHTDLAALGAVFAKDAKWQGKGRYKGAFGGFEGRDAIVKMIGSYCAPEAHFKMTGHFFSAEDIAVNGETATGKWMMLQCSTYKDDTSDLRSAALDMEFLRTAGKWEISLFKTTNIFSRTVDRWSDSEAINVPAKAKDGAVDD